MQLSRKPVPITRKNGGYIVPYCYGVRLGVAGGGTHNKTL